MIRRTRHTLLVAAAAVAFAFPSAAIASPEAAAKDEIDHLLNFVAASSCTFVRNGTEYPAGEAREHLASKYRLAGSRIATAEDFIRHLATQSSLSGAPYHVKCGKVEALSGVWLTDELQRYRKAVRVKAAR